ncbi:MAG TPA: hypothetical protein VML55_02570 [Planctomycetaceae bacterium]|nr:hypothetical protein [Planctomycetaceae bacterium]
MAAQFGYRLALIAFATATLRGALTGTDFEGTLQSALWAGVLFFALGMVCGELAGRVVEEQVEAEFERLLSGTDGVTAKSPAQSQHRSQSAE